jgi:uncharacterized protein YfaA (DUF2138 family)
VTLHNVDDFLQAKTLILGELKKHSHILDDKPRQLLSDLYFGIAMALKAQGIKFSCNDELDASDN